MLLESMSHHQYSLSRLDEHIARNAATKCVSPFCSFISCSPSSFHSLHYLRALLEAGKVFEKLPNCVTRVGDIENLLCSKYQHSHSHKYKLNNYTGQDRIVQMIELWPTFVPNKHLRDVRTARANDDLKLCFESEIVTHVTTVIDLNWSDKRGWEGEEEYKVGIKCVFEFDPENPTWEPVWKSALNSWIL